MLKLKVGTMAHGTHEIWQFLDATTNRDMKCTGMPSIIDI